VPENKSVAAGFVLGVTALLMWGAFPLFFKQLVHVPAFEVLAHRIVWSCLLLAVVISLFGRWQAVRQVFACKKTLLLLMASSFWISANWVIFIWAIANDHALQSSIGYYITPIMSVVFSVFFLSETLSKTHWAAVALAACGVVWMIAGVGEFPWIALSLGVSFAVYGLIRKRAGVDGLSGLFVETILLAPVAAVFLVWLVVDGTGVFQTINLRTDGFLLASGLITAVSLVLFAEATQRLALSTIGLLQYITPTGHLMVAVFIFGEAFTFDHGVTFAFIWAALVLYSGHSLRLMRWRAGGH